ncbi:gonadotropin-releasing hormone II receptor-like [Paramacrobiotus metropolitanus]|uniref:gonadotropin-releasing hormone II receptor-like n=1 Tax=Paramacrobiotus metropolitanus TaxID=2943436 RepID=UPI002445F126|nr:gonadotropin-releasing hormone II receptor-like [Paramacrobiotus metropolitanus]XP_055345633.1 gonadotropin-releasing hormone II receptor-like [Paramacrobiotus metropolitanus]XP_055345634.1 gonadotropin-releasing hormone II receptor-like [Paramacrobiotus metropolitanus]XP_055345635.1 gonadotropin-releasing hormone II receptor-like [Paramacrobiotus metropolitanus]
MVLPMFPMEPRFFGNMSLVFSDKHDPRCAGNWSLVFRFIAAYDPEYHATRPYIIGALLTLGAVGLISNVLVIVFLAGHGRFRTSGLSALMLQLAIADVMVSLFCLLVDGVWNVTVAWLGGEVLCRFMKFVQMLSLYASTMILTGMTVERCVTVIYPLSRCQPHIAMQRARTVSIVVWFFAIVFSTPQMLIFRVERAPICVDFYQCVTYGSYSEPWQEVAYTLATLLIMFVFPLIINVICCITISVLVSNEAKMAAGSRRTELQNGYRVRIASMQDPGLGRKAYRRTRQFSLWTTFCIAFIYMLCWCPYYASMVAYVFHYHLPSSWMTIILCFGMTSTVLNPVIYGIFRLLSARNRSERLRRQPSAMLSNMRTGSAVTEGSPFLHVPSSAVVASSA